MSNNLKFRLPGELYVLFSLLKVLSEDTIGVETLVISCNNGNILGVTGG